MDLPEILWPHNASCGARAVNVQNICWIIPGFLEWSFCCFDRSSTISTNYYNGNNNNYAEHCLTSGTKDTHTIHLIVRLLIPLYLSIQDRPTGFLWESYQTPSRSDGCQIVSDNLTHECHSFLPLTINMTHAIIKELQQVFFLSLATPRWRAFIFKIV